MSTTTTRTRRRPDPRNGTVPQQNAVKAKANIRIHEPDEEPEIYKEQINLNPQKVEEIVEEKPGVMEEEAKQNKSEDLVDESVFICS